MNQGCPGEGNDTRTLGWVVCWLQRRFSWHTDAKPALNEHPARGYTWALGWLPFYFVWNHQRSDGLWRMIRIGWRYDRNWGGYIGPAAACKKVPKPLVYY